MKICIKVLSFISINYYIFVIFNRLLEMNNLIYKDYVYFVFMYFFKILKLS